LSTPDTVLVVGPGATSIKRVGDDLVIAHRDGGPETTIADRVTTCWAARRSARAPKA
jgi:hypothetical protein